MLLLRGGASHGYSLMDGLREFGFLPGTVDASVVYRLLREMEDGGWVTSQWDTAGSGPPRRVYRVTEAGDRYLASWMEDLRSTRDEITALLAAYDRPGAWNSTDRQPQEPDESD